MQAGDTKTRRTRQTTNGTTQMLIHPLPTAHTRRQTLLRRTRQGPREGEGTATQRGYGAPHKRLRARWQAAIDNGAAPLCPRCHLPVTRGQAWDLGHNDRRDGYNGPEHASCNRKAGAANSNRMREHWNKQEPTPPPESSTATGGGGTPPNPAKTAGEGTRKFLRFKHFRQRLARDKDRPSPNRSQEVWEAANRRYYAEQDR